VICEYGPLLETFWIMDGNLISLSLYQREYLTHQQPKQRLESPTSAMAGNGYHLVMYSDFVSRSSSLWKMSCDMTKYNMKTARWLVEHFSGNTCAERTKKCPHRLPNLRGTLRIVLLGLTLASMARESKTSLKTTCANAGRSRDGADQSSGTRASIPF